MEITSSKNISMVSILSKSVSLGGKQYTDEDLMNACREFETLFTQELLKTMWATVPESELIKESQASKIWKDMYIEQLAKVSSQGRGLGVAETLYNQLRASQTYKRECCKTTN